MIDIEIPGRDNYEIRYLFLDVNGTLAVDGVLVSGVKERLQALSQHVEIIMLTADTHGKQKEIDAMLNINSHRLARGNEQQQKAAFVRERGARSSIAIGNGSNDVGMLQAAAIGIVVLGGEGASTEAINAADVLVNSSLDALDLLLKPRRLVATLRR